MLDLRSLPKAHLHIHIEAAMRRDTLQDLSARYGAKIPLEEECADAWDYVIKLYTILFDVLRTEKDVERLIDEFYADSAEEGVVWVEPTVLAPPYRAVFGDDMSTVQAFAQMMEAASARHGVRGGMLVIADRTASAEEALAQANVAARMAGRGVVGFGLANYEPGYPGAPFERAFALAKEAGLVIAPHAGELVGPEAVEEALDLLQADRIGHGVTAAQDPNLVARLAAGGVCLDVCPSSNLRLGMFAGWAEHPLPLLINAGVRCSINADDPIIFGVNMLDEYESCRARMGLTDRQLMWAARSSIEASAAEASLKTEWMAALEAESGRYV